jgi:16S rRNA (guanine966-N2)-methyltransferase
VQHSDVRAFLDRERRQFDVIFLDPPFASDPWPWLLPACVPLLSSQGLLYAEAARTLSPPGELRTFRSDKAGQVHYHLFARAEPG